MNTAALLSTLAAMGSNRLSNYAMPGLDSSLINRGVVRLFEASRMTEEHITPHSHRFNFTCLVLAGHVINTVYVENETTGDEYSVGVLRPVNGGLGQYSLQRTGNPFRYQRELVMYQTGDTYSMTHDQIHSIQFGAGARVLFFEEPPVTDHVEILEPWVRGKVVPTFKTEPWMFEKVDA